MKSKTSKTSDIHRLILNLSDKINLEETNKYVAPSNLSIYYTWKKRRNMKTINLKFQLQCELLDRSYSVSDIPDCFAYILPVRIHINKLKNRITFNI